MVRLSDIQIELLESLKNKGYKELCKMGPKIKVDDKRIKKGQSLEVTITKLKNNSLQIRSIANDLPPSKEQEKEIAKILGPDFPPSKTESIEWHGGFDIDSNGNIKDLHPDTYDD